MEINFQKLKGEHSGGDESNAVIFINEMLKNLLLSVLWCQEKGKEAAMIS